MKLIRNLKKIIFLKDLFSKFIICEKTRNNFQNFIKWSLKAFKQKLDKFFFFKKKYLNWKFLLKKHKINWKIQFINVLIKDVIKKKMNEKVEFYLSEENFQKYFLLNKKEKNKYHWIKLKTILRLKLLAYYSKKLKFLIKVLKKSRNFRINKEKTKIQRIKKYKLTSNKFFKQTVVIYNIPYKVTTSELLNFLSTYGEIFSIFLKILIKKEKHEYLVQNVEIIWKRIEEAQLFEQLKTIEFPKNDLINCSFIIGSFKKKRNYFFFSIFLKMIKLKNVSQINSGELKQWFSEYISSKFINTDNLYYIGIPTESELGYETIKKIKENMKRRKIKTSSFETSNYDNEHKLITMILKKQLQKLNGLKRKLDFT